MPPPSVKSTAWALFDALIAEREPGAVNPWYVDTDGRVAYEPDFDTLTQLLGIPVRLDARSQTGVPALALDVWVSYEFRRAGFDADAVWPRATAPRVLPREIATLMRNIKGTLGTDFVARVLDGTGLGGAVGANANLLGKNYVKQVDVGMSAWNTGPELLISTKRMDSSFGKNAANRVEESYGDAKNLRLRHPQAALGFLYGLNASALTSEPDKARWLIDLLSKLGREDDAYHAVALILPRMPSAGDGNDVGDSDPEEEETLAAALAGDSAAISDDEVAASEPADEADATEALPPPPIIELNHDAVPGDLRPGRFFDIMITRVLDNSPINFHESARARRANPRQAK